MDILTQQENGVLGIMLNRPQQRNALTGTMYDAMTRALDHAEHCSDVHVVLFGSSGGTFCAGNDVADFVNAPPLDHDSPVVQFLQRMSTAQKPLIAAVRGPAVGIGTTLLLHCDLVYATDSASFCLPFVRLGLCAEAGSSLLLPQLAGYQRAAESCCLANRSMCGKPSQWALSIVSWPNSIWTRLFVSRPQSSRHCRRNP